MKHFLGHPLITINHDKLSDEISKVIRLYVNWREFEPTVVKMILDDYKKFNFHKIQGVYL